jgi:hypothetical protein
MLTPTHSALDSRTAGPSRGSGALLAIEATDDDLHELNGRIALSANEAAVACGGLMIRQTLKPTPRVEVFWRGEPVMLLVAADAGGPERLVLTDGVWADELAEVPSRSWWKLA